MALESKQTSRSVHVKADNRVYQPRFGFECDTCCGSIPMPNEWESDWIVSGVRYVLCVYAFDNTTEVFTMHFLEFTNKQNFYAKQRLKYQIDLAMKKVCLYV